MEIDRLDDFDAQYQPKFELEQSNWNGHEIQRLFGWEIPLHEKLQQHSASISLISKTISRRFLSNAVAKTQTVIEPYLNVEQSQKDPWAPTKALVDFYLGQSHRPHEFLSESGLHAVSGPISLNDLLALDYLDREIQIVPFTLGWDANLAFIELPEGTSWATLQSPIEGVFQSYFPQNNQLLALDRSWWYGSPFYAIDHVESYLGLIASRYAEVVAAAQVKGTELAMESAKAATSAAATASNAAIASSQTSNPCVAIEQAKISEKSAQQAKDIAAKTEQESVIAESLAIAKANTAELEKQKAIDATTKAIFATEPPRLPPRGFSTKPKELILQEWNTARVLRAAEAESQSNIAASAAEEAKVALALAAEKKQIAAIAKEQALVAARAATVANSYVAKHSATTIFFVGGLPLIFQSRDLGELSRNEHTNQVFPQLELSDSLAGWNMDAKSTDLFQGIEFGELSYQQRGEVALAFGFYSQAAENFAKAIATDPSHSLAYLERGIAHFGLKEYELSLQDYRSFTSQIPNPLFISQFSLSFAKGLPKGAYEAGVGLFWFLVDFVSEPVQTSVQVFSSIFTLVNMVKNDEWGIIAEVLAPEIRQLVIQWDTLSLDQKGELAGHAIGKLGVDILLPGALSKVATKTVKGAQELAAVCKNLQIAHETLILETATGIGDVVKIAEIIETGQKTALFAEELGFTAKEVSELKQAGQLEAAVGAKYQHLNLSMQESFVLFDRAEEFLKPYKGFMSEAQCRELIHKAGIPTFPRPDSIPANFRVSLSDKGAGMIYMHPEHTHTSIRVMPGKPHSPFPHQQQPYVIYKKNGKTLDKFGNIINPKAPEAHIPITDFIFKDQL